MASQGWIALGAVLFVALHLALSHPPVRTPLVRVLGEWPFRGLYSAVAGGAFLLMLVPWWTHPHAGPFLWALRAPLWTHLAPALIALGFVLVGGGAIRFVPAAMLAPITDVIEVRGLAGFTRHPVDVGLTLVAVGHLLTNGWAGDVAFWGGILGVGVLGTVHQDWRKRNERPAYARFAAQITILPIPKRGALAAMDGVTWLGCGLGLATALVLRVFHGTLFG